MKKLFLLVAIMLLTTISYAQVGIGTEDPKATLDVTGKPVDATAIDGIIAPRLTGDQLAAKDAVYLADQTGTQVYVTAAATTPTGKTINVTAPGYYYYDGSVWVAVASGSSTVDKNIYDADGTLTGNRTVTQGANSLTFTGTGNTIFNSGNVGIGTNNPSHQLHILGTTGEAAIRLNATGSNLLRQFSGGTDGAARFSIGSGLSPDRIVLHSNGSVGIGTLDPETALHVNGIIRARAATTTGYVQLESGNATQAGYIRFSNPNGSSNGYIGWTPNMMNYVSENGAHHVFTNGNVGIGTTTPNAPLQFANVLANRKIVLYEGLNNNNQYYGFGVNSGVLRYQVNGINDRHTFFAGVDGASSTELMTIRGNGRVGIGTVNPNSTLDVTGSPASTTTPDGIIAPRITGDQLAAKNAVYLANQTGTQVYVTAAATTPAGKTINVTAPGQYYYDGTVWQKTSSTTEAWGLKGNTATNPATDFLGTTDANRLLLKTNNKTAITASENGTVTIGANNLLAEYPTATHENPLFRVNQGNVEIFKSNPGSYDAVTRSYITVDSTYNHFAARAISGTFAAGQGLNSAKTGYENKPWTGVSDFVTIIQAEGDNYSTDPTGRVDNLVGFNSELGFWASNPNGVVRNATGLSVNANAKGALDNSLHTSYGANITSRASGGNVGANAFGYRVGATQATSTGVNNAYGLFINNVASSGGTTNNAWSIYSQTTAPSFLNGNVGIGTATPNAPLQFSNALTNRKIVLFQVNNNDHQYFGFGLNNGVFRYQVNSTTDRHTFFAGVDAATSTELMTIRGNGNVGIGTVNPSHQLHISSTTGEAAIRLSATGTNLLRQFSGGTDGAARFSIGSGLSPDRIVLHSNGLVGIGTLDPEAPLHVTGTIRARAATTTGYVQLESGNATQAGFIRFNNPNGSSNGYIGWTPNMMNYVSENGAHHVFTNGNVGIGTGTTAPTSRLQVNGLPAYPSDAAAGAAGLTAGAFYQTNGAGTGIFANVGVLMVKQ